MLRLRNIVLAGVTIAALGVMAMPAEANHRGRGGYRAPQHSRHFHSYRAPHYSRHHHSYRAPHHLRHHHRLYGPHIPAPVYRSHPGFRYGAPGFGHPYYYAPRPGVGIGVFGPGGGIHFRF